MKIPRTENAKKPTKSPIFRLILAVTAFAVASFANTASTYAEDPVLLYNWHFDADTGSAVNNTGTAAGGTLAMLNGSGAPTNLHGSAGSGRTGQLTDIAFDTSTGGIFSQSPIAISETGTITTSSLSKLTITGWLKDTGESNYSELNVSRILTIGPSGYDGATSGGILNPAPTSSLALNVYNLGSSTGALQLRVNGAGGQTGFDGLVSTSNILPATGEQWFFFAVTYDATAPIAFDGSMYTNTNAAQPTVAMFLGNSAQTITTSAFAGAYPGVTGNTPSSPGPVQFTNAFGALMNRTNASRNSPYVGFADDFRIYDSVLTTAQLNAVRLNLPFQIKGDFNNDSILNGADLTAMLKALTNLEQFQADRNLTPAQLEFLADLNGDMLVTNLDIQSLSNLIAVSIPPATTGDMNRDGQITQADLPLLLKALTDLEKFRLDRSIPEEDFATMCDINGDLLITNLDIQALVNLLSTPSGGSLAAVPEPSVWAGISGLFVSFWGFRLAGKINFFGFSFPNRTKYLHRL